MIEEIQKDIDLIKSSVCGWVEGSLGMKVSPENIGSIVEKLQEECAELKAAVAKGEEPRKILEEASDCMIVLVQVFGAYGGDISQGVWAKMKKNRERVWLKVGGVFHHI